MRLLIVDLGRDYRGGQHQALLLLRGLLARGHAPELIALRDSLLAHRAKDAGISVCGVDPRRKRLAAAMEIRRLVQGAQVDAVHANEPHALTSAWLARAHRVVPVVASRRIALPLSSNLISLARYRSAARIIAVSHFVEKSVVASGLPAGRIEVIYDGVEIPAAISPAGLNRLDKNEHDEARLHFAIPAGNPCLGNVAALIPEKGQALLIRSMAIVCAQFPTCMLLLAGKGPEQAKLQELALELQVSSRVKFLDSVSDIEKALAAIDIFVFPSHEEPLGSALLLAMAHGLPSVAMAAGGIPEIIADGQNGLLVKGLDPVALAAAITQLLANPSEAARMGHAARQTISTRFSADRMVDATLKLYQTLIAER